MHLAPPMTRIVPLLALMALVLAACGPGSNDSTGPAGAKIYRISRSDVSEIQFRTLDSVNSLRQAAGVAPLEINAQLTSAAATHSRDMSVQNRPWHFGSDGSSPIDRTRRSGFPGQFREIGRAHV